MEPMVLFGIQFTLSLLAYLLIAFWYVAPRLSRLPREVALVPLLWVHAWVADGRLLALRVAWVRPAARAGPQPALPERGRAAAQELQAWGDACGRQPAGLRQFDGWGQRIDEVVYPPAWRELAAVSARTGLVALPYEPATLARVGAEARVVQAALGYLFAPSTATYLCPVAMTDGAARVLTDG